MKYFVSELHHHVLVPWSDFRRKEFLSGTDEAPTVLVLDHHTDVVRAFRDEAKIVEEGAWKDEKAVASAVARLRHDEHFDWAVRSALVKKCIISSHVNSTSPSDGRLLVRCHDDWGEDENELFRCPEKFRAVADSVIETSYLEKVFPLPLPERFILDVDCDYFLTEKSFHPSDGSFFSEMMKKALLVTFSREEDWIRLLKFKGENFTSEDVIKTLAERI